MCRKLVPVSHWAARSTSTRGSSRWSTCWRHSQSSQMVKDPTVASWGSSSICQWEDSYSPDNSLCEVTRTGPIHSKPNQHKDHPFNTKDIQCCYICPTAFIYTLPQDSNFPRSIQISALHLNLKQDRHQISTVNPPIFVTFAALRTLRQTMSHHPFHPSNILKYGAFSDWFFLLCNID